MTDWLVKNFSEAQDERVPITRVFFDNDGTISKLRDGWEAVMAPMMAEAICGEGAPPPVVCEEVEAVIAETTGQRTIRQMERLATMVQQHARVPPEQVLDPWDYKGIYLDRLMAVVGERIHAVASGSEPAEAYLVPGAQEFLGHLHSRGIPMHVFSGTDEADVERELEVLGVRNYFVSVHGAAKTRDEPDLDKTDVLERLLDTTDSGAVAVFGDGPVEIRAGNAHGCVTVGVCTVDGPGGGWNPRKRARLEAAGADWLIPDFSRWEQLIPPLMG